jgi:predicted dehydrogenase
MERRFLLTAAAGVAANRILRGQPRRWRVCIIGHTGHGNYGHGIDIVWKSIGNAEVLAVADPVPDGAAKAVQRTGAARSYADYREMLRQEKPDVVSICPRWLDQRVAMVEAVARAGAHIYMEKPLAASLAEADRIVATVRKHNVKLQLAHVMRASPYVRQAAALLRGGAIGTLLEMRGRGKEDNRAGGEDLIVLGSHILDLFRLFAGDPAVCFAHVTRNGADIRASDARTPSEPVGRVAGNQVNAVFSFAGGVHGYFGSMAGPETDRMRFGVYLYGSRGVLFVPNEIFPAGQPYILRSPGWMPTARAGWEPVTLADPAPAASPLGAQHLSNVAMVQDLLDAVQSGRQPMCSEIDGRWTVEMVAAVYQSHLTGRRLSLPLQDRTSGLE